MIRLVGLVQCQPFLVAREQAGFAPGGGGGAGFFGGGNGFVKASCLRISCRQSAEKFSVFVLGEHTSPFGVDDGCWPVADPGIGTGGQ